MTVKTTRWDSAEYLKTEEDIQLYLEACLEEAGDDTAFILHALGVIARARNMSQLARETGLTSVHPKCRPSRNVNFGAAESLLKPG